ncbi:MAG: hypothetical protein WAV78_11680 [Xanthobacteraceae bacterium]
MSSVLRALGSANVAIRAGSESAGIDPFECATPYRAGLLLSFFLAAGRNELMAKDAMNTGE